MLTIDPADEFRQLVFNAPGFNWSFAGMLTPETIRAATSEKRYYLGPWTHKLSEGKDGDSHDYWPLADYARAEHLPSYRDCNGRFDVITLISANNSSPSKLLWWRMAYRRYMLGQHIGTDSIENKDEL